MRLSTIASCCLFMPLVCRGEEVIRQADLLAGVDAGMKYRVAQLAMKDEDFALAERLLREAVLQAPENGTLRYEFANFLAEQGKGSEALNMLEGLEGDENTRTQALYLKIKLQIAGELNGSYYEQRKQVLTPGGLSGQTQATSAVSINGTGKLGIEYGKVIWSQNIQGRKVEQYYHFLPHKLPSAQGRYELNLRFEKLESGLQGYHADSDARLLATRTDNGWQMQLICKDELGQKSIVELLPTKVP